MAHQGDLILNGGYTPTYDEISDVIKGEANERWRDLNAFIQKKYNAAPKIMYSKCSAEPGWNIKYQKSGKSLCTLYPKENDFIVLVVILLDLIPLLEAMSGEFDQGVMEVVRGARPFNGTKWLMIQVNSDLVLDTIKQLLDLKNEVKNIKGKI